MYNLLNKQFNQYSNNYYRQQRKRERYKRRVVRCKQKRLFRVNKKFM